MFNKRSTADYKDALPGIRQETLVFGERTLMTEFLLKANHPLPEHAHPFEQTGYLVSGHIMLKIGDETCDTSAGDSWCIPANVKHGARVIEDSVAVEVFSPVRQDYLPGKK
jgi:quercetin dioxygenase-like cupin family protein